MQHQWVRVSLVLLMLVIAIASAYRFIVIEQQRTLEREAAAAYESLSWTLTASLADLRASQQAYVATGQTLVPWVENTEQEFEDISVSLASLEELSLPTGSLDALGDTRATIDRLRRVDEIAREHAIKGQALMASDLVFTDGRDLAGRAGSHLELARSVEREGRALQQDEQRRTQVASVAMASAVALLVAVLLCPSPTTRTMSQGADVAASPFASGEALERDEPALELELVLDPPGSNSGPAPPEAAAAPPSSSSAEPESIVPDLRLAAEVCTDLGRLSDGAELGSILARAGQVLNASGLVVWVRDESGAALRAATGYGYTANQLSRLGRVSCDSDNVTAAAYRTAQLQTVLSEDNLPGALAVPLLAASPTAESVGVLSVELARGWETSEAVQATASILAAQLATFVTADPAPASDDVEAGDREAHAVG